MDPQATRDLVTAATLAFQDGDEVAQEAAKQSWKDVARRYWAKSAADDALAAELVFVRTVYEIRESEPAASVQCSPS